MLLCLQPSGKCACLLSSSGDCVDVNRIKYYVLVFDIFYLNLRKVKLIIVVF